VRTDHNHRGTTRTLSKLECCASSQRQRAPTRLCRATHVVLAWSWRPQLARRTTVLHRRRESSRRCGALLRGVSLLQPSRHGARSKQAQVLPLFSQETVSAGAPALRDTPRWLGAGGRSWHVVPRLRAEKERPLAGAAPFGREWADQDQRSTAHARSKVECCASFPETASISSMRRARHAALAWRRTPQLARHTAVVRLRGEGFRRRSALLQGTG